MSSLQKSIRNETIIRKTNEINNQSRVKKWKQNIPLEKYVTLFYSNQILVAVIEFVFENLINSKHTK